MSTLYACIPHNRTPSEAEVLAAHLAICLVRFSAEASSPCCRVPIFKSNMQGFRKCDVMFSNIKKSKIDKKKRDPISMILGVSSMFTSSSEAVVDEANDLFDGGLVSYRFRWFWSEIVQKKWNKNKKDDFDLIDDWRLTMRKRKWTNIDLIEEWTDLYLVSLTLWSRGETAKPSSFTSHRLNKI